MRNLRHLSMAASISPFQRHASFAFRRAGFATLVQGKVAETRLIHDLPERSGSMRWSKALVSLEHTIEGCIVDHGRAGYGYRLASNSQLGWAAFDLPKSSRRIQRTIAPPGGCRRTHCRSAIRRDFHACRCLNPGMGVRNSRLRYRPVASPIRPESVGDNIAFVVAFNACEPLS